MNGTRKIWTALDGVNYWQGEDKYNNWKTKNEDKINNLFQLTGLTVQDYHNKDSACASDDNGVRLSDTILDERGIENGNGDDIEGLINFVRGSCKTSF